MRALVWRYVCAQSRKGEESPVTEDDINEVKSDISTMRYEMLEIFENSGMDCSSASKKEKPCRARRVKAWERRLMKGFQVAPVRNINEQDSPDNGNINVNGVADINEIKVEKEPSRPSHETPKERFRRVARAIASQSAAKKWSAVLQGVAKNSQIGCGNNDGFSSLRHLDKAIEEARKLILLSPQRSGQESPLPVEFQDEKTTTLLDLLNEISQEIRDSKSKYYKKQETKSKQQFKPTVPLAREVNAIIKNQILREQTNNKKSPTSTDMSSGKTNEVTLSASSLVTQMNKLHANSHAASMKKLPPSIPKPLHSTHKPFFVETNYLNRRSTPFGNSFDITVVDLDESIDNSIMDTHSEVSSVVDMNTPSRQLTMQNNSQRNERLSMNMSLLKDQQGGNVQISNSSYHAEASKFDKKLH